MSKTALLINDNGDILARGSGSDMLAQRDEQGGHVIAAAEDLEEAVTGSVMAEMYNARVPEADQIKKFSTKADGAERVWDLLQETEADNEQEDKTVAKKAKKAKKSTTKDEGKKGSPGRTSKYAGKKVHKTEAGKERTYREGSRRTASWNVLTEGMLYETALEKGAHPTDLAILTKDGYVEWVD